MGLFTPGGWASISRFQWKHKIIAPFDSFTQFEREVARDHIRDKIDPFNRLKYAIIRFVDRSRNGMRK